MYTLGHTLADALAGSSMHDRHLSPLLRMIGEGNVAARMEALADAAVAALTAVRMFEAERRGFLTVPGPNGCDEETFAKMAEAHEAAMAARDLYFHRQVLPLIKQAQRLNTKNATAALAAADPQPPEVA